MVDVAEKQVDAEKRSFRNGAEFAIASLEANGVDTIFGIPGVHTLAIYDALRTSSIRHILARHEQGAGFMADGYARASGKPGVACVITGPGVTNIATPIGEAYTDSSPVFVISSNNELAHIDQMRGNLHDLKDQLGVMAAVTQWNTRVTAGLDASDAVAEGFRRMLGGRPLPVHVEFPLDVLDEVLTGDETIEVAVASRPVLSDALLDDAANLLAGARRIVIYCGGGAVHAEASAEIQALADLLGAVVLTSIQGKGSIPEDHARSVGALWDPENPVDGLLQQADAALVLGSKLGVQATAGFKLKLPEKTVRVDIDPVELTLNHQPAVGIVGDAGQAVRGLLTRLGESGYQGEGYATEAIAAARSEAEKTAFHADRRAYLDALRRAVPRDGITVFDMTQMSYVGCYLYPVYEPRTYLFPSGYGTLGFAMPAAIGAKVACPDKAVVAVCGDGGYQFTMSELAVAIQHRIGVPIVIFNDSTYSAVKEAQLHLREGRYAAVDLVNPDYVALAAAYGIVGVRANSPEELEQAVKDALPRDLPTIIDVPIEGWV